MNQENGRKCHILSFKYFRWHSWDLKKSDCVVHKNDFVLKAVWLIANTMMLVGINTKIIYVYNEGGKHKTAFKSAYEKWGILEKYQQSSSVTL